MSETKTIKSENFIRGVHVDLCRHFIPLPMLCKLIEKMSVLNFNTLHLHLTDDQSFAFVSERYPQTAQFPGKQLTIEDQVKLFECAQKYKITVIPEIDIPGHSTAFRHLFYKEILETKLGVITSGFIDIKRDLPCILNMFDELRIRFKTNVIHMGGDECSNFPFFEELVLSVTSWASKLDIKVMVWDEVLKYVKKLPDNLIVHHWHHRKSSTSSTLSSIYLLRN